MGKSKEIRNIAIVGTGVIGASWAALYLARGLNVIATDPAPNAEANLRGFIDAAWKDLQVIGLSPNASRDHLQFTTDMKKALSNADLVQENGPERQGFQDQAVCRHGRCYSARRFDHRVQFIGADYERDAIYVQASRTLRNRPPV
jgi:3-hydroxyacyl-CoA dehydrogenase